jgi:hypothetical protein
LGWSAGAGSQGATLGWSAGEGIQVGCWGAGAGRAAVFPAGAWGQCNAIGWSAGEGSRGRSGEPETGRVRCRRSPEHNSGAGARKMKETRREGGGGGRVWRRRETCARLVILPSLAELVLSYSVCAQGFHLAHARSEEFGVGLAGARPLVRSTWHTSVKGKRFPRIPI